MNKVFWLSWVGSVAGFEYHGPWWSSGWDVYGRPVHVAAVTAKDERAARKIIYDAYDEGKWPAEWRFTEEKEEGWAPFSDRFQRADWMKWPYPKDGAGEV